MSILESVKHKEKYGNGNNVTIKMKYAYLFWEVYTGRNIYWQNFEHIMLTLTTYIAVYTTVKLFVSL